MYNYTRFMSDSVTHSG